ncbi:MAG: DUF6159 family protein [Mycobacterium sp.]
MGTDEAELGGIEERPVAGHFPDPAAIFARSRSLRGEDTKVGEGLSAAMRRIGPILGWTLVAFTVGLVLRFLENRFPIAGRIAVWISGAAWAIATFFVVPVIALEGTGPFRSPKRSVQVVKAKWGEGATGQVASSAVTG